MFNKLVELKGAIGGSLSLSREKITVLYRDLKGHLLNEDNPHRTDKWHIGLSKVQNYPPATKEQVIQGRHNTSNVTPKRLEQHMEARIYTPLTQLFEDAINQLDE